MLGPDSLIIRSARRRSESGLVDIIVRDGRVAAILPEGETPAAGRRGEMPPGIWSPSPSSTPTCISTRSSHSSNWAMPRSPTTRAARWARRCRRSRPRQLSSTIRNRRRCSRPGDVRWRWPLTTATRTSGLWPTLTPRPARGASRFSSSCATSSQVWSTCRLLPSPRTESFENPELRGCSEPQCRSEPTLSAASRGSNTPRPTWPNTSGSSSISRSRTTLRCPCCSTTPVTRVFGRSK